MKPNMSDTLEAARPFWPQVRDLGPLPVDYQSWTAGQKQRFIWEDRILASRYKTLPPLKPIDVMGLFRTALRKKMNRQADEVPTPWEKAVHAHGSVAKIKLVSAVNTPFTGLFEEAECGLLRMSLTEDPRRRGVAPGLAIKLFVDGTHSENVSALVSLTGQGKNYNVLANEFSNIVPPARQFGPKLINFIFMRVSRFPNRLSLRDWATVNQYGEQVASPQAPYQIFLVPNPNIRFVSRSPHDFRDDMARIEPDTRLFTIYALDPRRGNELKLKPDKVRTLAQCIGYIDTTSEFVASFYGDRQLFFRHQRFRR